MKPRRGTIVAVEHDPYLSDFLALFLTDLGFDAKVARDVDAAAGLIASTHPILVIYHVSAEEFFSSQRPLPDLERLKAIAGNVPFLAIVFDSQSATGAWDLEVAGVLDLSLLGLGSLETAIDRALSLLH